MRRIAVFLLGLLLGAGVRSASAGDGRTQISQADALAGGVTLGDAPGFPVGITAPGSYVLTGDLAVPAGTTGILITADDVTLDLAGFTLRGPATCTAVSCPSSAASGIAVFDASVAGTVVENGGVSGFGADCVSLGGWARAERLTVRACGETGITAGAGSQVLDSSVASVGGTGIALGEPSVRGGNTSTGVSLAAAGSPAMSGGAPTRGNTCPDGTCSRHAKRRYYLSKLLRPAATAFTACASGYHMASIYELMDPSSLEYDPVLGDSREASPTGPISVNSGWVRSGDSANTTSNCSAWTSTNASHTGKVAILQGSVSSMNGAATDGSPWSISAGGVPCTNTVNVWCVED